MTILNTSPARATNRFHLVGPAAVGQEDRLLIQLHRLLCGEDPILATHLTTAQFECLKALYLPSIPNSSSIWSVRAQHVSDGCTALFRAIHPEGMTRRDFRKTLERVRYVDFLRSFDAWVDGTTNPRPPRLEFDVRGRAHAKEVFGGVLEHVGIPSQLLEVGVLTPLYLPNLGYAIRATRGESTMTFLVALPSGERLRPIAQDRVTVFRGMISPNRQLFNLLERQAPVVLEKALAPRTVLRHGTTRVALFCSTKENSPSKFVHLPPSITEQELSPVVDIASLQTGRKVFHLNGTISRKRIATIELPTLGSDTSEPLVRVFAPTSKLKQGVPFLDFAQGEKIAPPTPLVMEVNRRVVSDNYVHLRVLLAGQMSAPAQYPLRRLTVHALTSNAGKPYIGLYPPGVSPVATPPMKAYVRDLRRDCWTPIEAEVVWTPDQVFQDKVKKLAGLVVHGTPSASRDAWASLHRLSSQNPLQFQALILSDHNPVSLSTSPEMKAVRSLAGWSPFVAAIEDGVLSYQAQSVPHVARLLGLVLTKSSAEAPWPAINKLRDDTFVTPRNPLSAITRLAVVAPEALQQTIDELRQSPIAAVSNLASGKRSIVEFVASLPTPSQRIPTTSPRLYLSRDSMDFDDSVIA